MWLRKGTAAGSSQNANVQTRSTKCDKFLSIQLLATKEGLCSAEMAIYEEIITNDYYDLGSTRKRIIQTFARMRTIFIRRVLKQMGPKSAKPLYG
jgi:hypothetical protein